MATDDDVMKIQQCTIDGGVIRFDYPLIDRQIVLDYDACSPEMQRALGLHGGKQIIGDQESGAKLNVKDVTRKADKAQARIDAIMNGSWKLERGANESTVIEAVAEEKNLTIEAVLATLKPLSKEDRKAKIGTWRAHNDIKIRMNTIETRKLKKLAKDATVKPFEM